jgi:hypothetical protein
MKVYFRELTKHVINVGLGTYSPVGYPQIAIEHGHRYNFFCAPDPISNQDMLLVQ